MFNCLLTLIVNQHNANPNNQYILAFWHAGNSPKVKLSNRMGKEGNLSDFKQDMVVGARQAISEIADLLGF